MLLTIDVGNTNIVLGLFDQDQLLETLRFSSKETRTADEFGLLLLQYMNHFGLRVDAIEGVILSTVVPDGLPTLLRALEKYTKKKPLVVDRDLFPALRYTAEGQLGTDRSVCCDAAMSQYGAPILVLDLGTATTIDAVSADGYYLGGSILAGLTLCTDALAGKTAQLPRIELQKPDTFLGYNTTEQIQIGSVSGYIGGLAYLLRETRQEMNCAQRVKIVATGGLAHLVAAHLPEIDLVDETLMLNGLRLLYERHCNTQTG